ncbi:hypothetical protein [Paludibaculum fermentans]|uniref:hypothetical protein n=1 Tax=Paludibaculum fermentans TaxID=1473598 RepID=UPI003EB6A9FC
MIWRTRICFTKDGILCRGPFRTVRHSYADIATAVQSHQKVDVRFTDGSSLTANRHMAELSKVVELLASRAQGKR